MNEEIKTMKERIDKALNNPIICKKALEDFTDTLVCTGLNRAIAYTLSQKVIEILVTTEDLNDAEKMVYALFLGQKVKNNNLVQTLDEKVAGRSDIVFGQIKKYIDLGEVGGREEESRKVIDFGAGDGKITQLIQDNLKIDIDAYDVVVYPADGVTIKLNKFDGVKVPVVDNYYDTAVVTNVIHHEKENEKIIKELTRIVGRKIIIIETVPVGESVQEIKEDHERTFLNDYLYNRLFHYGDNIPVPGTYETPDGWEGRFKKHGWKVVHSEDLGVDQEVIKDTHHLLILEK